MRYHSIDWYIRQAKATEDYNQRMGGYVRQRALCHPCLHDWPHVEYRPEDRCNVCGVKRYMVENQPEGKTQPQDNWYKRTGVALSEEYRGYRPDD